MTKKKAEAKANNVKKSNAVVVYKKPKEKPERPDINFTNIRDAATHYAVYLVDLDDFYSKGKYGFNRKRYTVDMLCTILTKIGYGVSPYSAIISSGIAKDTHADWKKNKPDLVGVIELFEEASIATLESMVHKHAASDWRAGAFMLERRKRSIYGKEVEAPTNDTQKEMVEAARLLGKYAE